MKTNTISLTTGQVISLGDGRLACGMDEVYTTVNRLLDENITTIGLLAAGRYLKPRIQEAAPWVTDLPEMPNLDGVDRDERAELIFGWVDDISAKVGETHEIPDLSDGWVKRSIEEDIKFIEELRGGEATHVVLIRPEEEIVSE